MENNDFIILSSRIRLARNIEGYEFPHYINTKKADELLNMVFNACDNIGDFNCYRLRTQKSELLSEQMEDNLITKELVANKEFSGVAVSSDGSVSIMINEEDHIREQCTLKGLSLKKAFDIITDVDSELSEQLKFSYDEKLGYITACPTNLGTGIRASVVMFLPALTMTKNIQQVIDTVTKIGISIRGTHGENSAAEGYLFQISNQGTLGRPENEIIQTVESTILKICELEKSARMQLLELNKNKLIDDVHRAYGILTSCYTITSYEAVELLSKIKLGISLNVISLKSNEIIDELLNSISAIKINKISNSNLDETGRDLYRAQYLNRVLKNTKI